MQMEITKRAEEYHERMFPGYTSKFLETDPEFIERFDNFAFDEVVNQDDLDDRTRMMAILATLIGSGCAGEYRAMLPVALNFGVTPVEVKEVVYQAVAYLGIGRVFDFLHSTNDILIARGVKLQLEGQATTTTESRLEGGITAQVDIFGDGMREFHRSGPEESRHINRWLADNCFGDYYTRTGLDYRQREMITFCFLAAQGGCERQLTAHAAANMRIGNDRRFLIKAISQCLPFIGYPRSLNALRCVDDASDKPRTGSERRIAEHIGDQREVMTMSRYEEVKNGVIFPVGKPLPETFSTYFIGQAYLNMLTTDGVGIGNVTFEPSCRNNWHIHHKGGQILLVTGGKGWYQAWGEKAKELHPGDVVNIPAEVKHWHGAASDSWFSHLAIEVPAEGASNEWLEAVTDEVYGTLE
jgi:4-carboxymuconolactone decarboxylase